MSDYQHLDEHHQSLPFPVGKVVCVGRNYADHAKELGNEVPTSPILFIKPSTSLVHLEDSLDYPKDKGSCHFETEIAVLIQQDLKDATAEQVEAAIWGYALAFDLTLRDIQNQLKQKGHPWERAKAFDGSCPVTTFVNKSHFPNAPQKMRYQLFVDQVLRQNGDTNNMLFPIVELIQHISQTFTLKAGDIILTGTPAGVGQITKSQMNIQLEHLQWQLKID